jgi:hypothetical protein
MRGLFLVPVITLMFVDGTLLAQPDAPPGARVRISAPTLGLHGREGFIDLDSVLILDRERRRRGCLGGNRRSVWGAILCVSLCCCWDTNRHECVCLRHIRRRDRHCGRSDHQDRPLGGNPARPTKSRLRTTAHWAVRIRVVGEILASVNILSFPPYVPHRMRTLTTWHPIRGGDMLWGRTVDEANASYGNFNVSVRSNG